MSEHTPTIYVIGGLPRTGKTTLANQLSHNLLIGSMETDHIRSLFDTKPASKISFVGGADIKTVTAKLRPRLESLIGAVVRANNDFIINGECIDPRMVVESPHSEALQSCFLGLNDPEAAFDRIRRVHAASDWASHKSDVELKNILTKYARRSEKLGSLCLQFGLPYFDASENFLDVQQEAYSLLTLSTDTQLAS